MVRLVLFSPLLELRFLRGALECQPYLNIMFPIAVSGVRRARAVNPWRVAEGPKTLSTLHTMLGIAQNC